MFADFVDGADVRMVECGCGLRFTLESFQHHAICRDFIGQEFQCNMAFEAQIFRFIHHAHSAAAKLIENPVVGNCFTNHN